jgi:seipin
VTSKPAQKSYLNTILFVIASSILGFLAAVAYVFFYYNFIPQIGITAPVHLQFM